MILAVRVDSTADAINTELMNAAAAAAGVDTSAGVPNIAGIKKIDDYSVEVQVKGFSAPAVYSILGLSFWSYLAAGVLAGVIAFLVLMILIKTNLSGKAIVLVTILAFLVYAYSILVVINIFF